MDAFEKFKAIEKKAIKAIFSSKVTKSLNQIVSQLKRASFKTVGARA